MDAFIVLGLALGDVLGEIDGDAYGLVLDDVDGSCLVCATFGDQPGRFQNGSC